MVGLRVARVGVDAGGRPLGLQLLPLHVQPREPPQAGGLFRALPADLDVLDVLGLEAEGRQVLTQQTLQPEPAIALVVGVEVPLEAGYHDRVVARREFALIRDPRLAHDAPPQQAEEAEHEQHGERVCPVAHEARAVEEGRGAGRRVGRERLEAGHPRLEGRDTKDGL